MGNVSFSLISIFLGRGIDRRRTDGTMIRPDMGNEAVGVIGWAVFLWAVVEIPPERSSKEKLITGLFWRIGPAMRAISKKLAFSRRRPTLQVSERGPK